MALNGQATSCGNMVIVNAYQIAVKNGFKGTEAEWLESLKGEPGQPGRDGTPGRDGKDGLPGKDGANGKDGQPGKDGANGKDGSPGAKGDKGDKGDPGAKGDKGDTGATGAKGQDGKTPVKGTDYWTDADKAEIVEEVLEQIPESSGGGGGGDTWELICTITPDGTTSKVTQNFDADYKKIKLVVRTQGNTVVSKASATDKWKVNVIYNGWQEVTVMSFTDNSTWRAYVGEAEVMGDRVVGTGISSFSNPINAFGTISGYIEGIAIVPSASEALIYQNTFYVYGVRV